MTAKTIAEITRRIELAVAVTEAGACTEDDVHHDVFHPLGHGGRRRRSDVDIYAEARAICERCTVRAECRELADLYGNVHGMWGGEDPDERAARRRQTREANHG